MAYFRLKLLHLPEGYKQFLADHLDEAGTIFTLECTLRWPVTHVSERHVFQFGGLGGCQAEEYLYGSARMQGFLQRYHSHVSKWDPPSATLRAPEAEWGFVSPLEKEVEAFARERNYNFRRILIEEPQDFALPVVDLYERWYEELGISAKRLLIECFALIEPWWTVYTGTIPFWLAFNTEPGLAVMSQYLQSKLPFEDIFVITLSSGSYSVDLITIEEWKMLLSTQARNRYAILGVDPQKFPLDLGSFVLYHKELKRKLSENLLPLPKIRSLRLEELDSFLKENASKYPSVQWMGHNHYPRQNRR